MGASVMKDKDFNGRAMRARRAADFNRRALAILKISRMPPSYMKEMRRYMNDCYYFDTIAERKKKQVK
jgi:hypothetical protein